MWRLRFRKREAEVSGKKLVLTQVKPRMEQQALLLDPMVWWCNPFVGMEGSTKGQIPHGSATTTYAVRAVLQQSQAWIAELSREPGINPKTAANGLS